MRRLWRARKKVKLKSLAMPMSEMAICIMSIKNRCDEMIFLFARR
jgi:hypothetical protein